LQFRISVIKEKQKYRKIIKNSDSNLSPKRFEELKQLFYA
jgi:hypothetical protein